MLPTVQEAGFRALSIVLAAMLIVSGVVGIAFAPRRSGPRPGGGGRRRFVAASAAGGDSARLVVIGGHSSHWFSSLSARFARRVVFPFGGAARVEFVNHWTTSRPRMTSWRVSPIACSASAPLARPPVEPTSLDAAVNAARAAEAVSTSPQPDARPDRARTTARHPKRSNPRAIQIQSPPAAPASPNSRPRPPRRAPHGREPGVDRHEWICVSSRSTHVNRSRSIGGGSISVNRAAPRTPRRPDVVRAHLECHVLEHARTLPLAGCRPRHAPGCRRYARPRPSGARRRGRRGLRRGDDDPRFDDRQRRDRAARGRVRREAGDDPVGLDRLSAGAGGGDPDRRVGGGPVRRAGCS